MNKYQQALIHDKEILLSRIEYLEKQNEILIQTINNIQNTNNDTIQALKNSQILQAKV